MPNVEAIAWITGILVISLAPGFVILWRVRTLGGDTLLISKRRLLKVAVTTLPIMTLFTFVPGGALVEPLFIALVVYLALKPGELDAGDLGEESAAVLGNIKKIQEDLSAAELHLQGLSTRIQVSQRDILDRGE